MITRVTDALILAAGSGSRLNSGSSSPTPKALLKIGGRPLISYTIDALARAGVQRFHVVVGANGETLAAALRDVIPAPLELHAIANPHWQRQNGVSVLCGEGKVRAPFFLTMADHLFQFRILEQLLASGDPKELNLAIDRKVADIFDLDDAMKVQTANDRITAIGKTLADYDAIDTGVFLSPASLFTHLRAIQHEGDCSLAEGVAVMAQAGEVRAIDIGEAWWQDVDTAAMLGRAETQVSRLTDFAVNAHPGADRES